VRVLSGQMWFSLSGTSPGPHEARIAAAAACWPRLGPYVLRSGGATRDLLAPSQVFSAAAGSMYEGWGGVGGGSLERHQASGDCLSTRYIDVGA